MPDSPESGDRALLRDKECVIQCGEMSISMARTSVEVAEVKLVSLLGCHPKLKGVSASFKVRNIGINTPCILTKSYPRKDVLEIDQDRVVSYNLR